MGDAANGHGHTPHGTRKVSVHLRPDDTDNLEFMRRAISPRNPELATDSDVIRHSLRLARDAEERAAKKK